MKTLIIIVTLIIWVSTARATDTTATHKPTSYQEFSEPGCVVFEREQKIRDKDPNGWKYDFWEYHKLLNGFIVTPVYFKDPVKGSNGGTDWA